MASPTRNRVSSIVSGPSYRSPSADDEYRCDHAFSPSRTESEPRSVPPALNHRREGDHIDRLLNVRPDGLDLVLLLLLRVGELELDARILERRLDRDRAGSAVAALLTDLRETDDQVAEVR